MVRDHAVNPTTIHPKLPPATSMTFLGLWHIPPAAFNVLALSHPCRAPQLIVG